MFANKNYNRQSKVICQKAASPPHIHQSKEMYYNTNKHKLECVPMPNVMAALPNIGGALC